MEKQTVKWGNVFSFAGAFVALLIGSGFATGQEVIAQMFALNRALGSTLVLVTHDTNLAKQCQQQLTMQAGRLTPGVLRAQG